jgi:Major Facilitator Superfamily
VEHRQSRPAALDFAGVRRYRALLRVPGARAPLVASALGSLPIGMYIVAILLLAREATGSFADAGRVVGAFGLANALGAVAQGRLMDRHGQPRVLRAAAAGHALAIAALVVAAERGAPSVVLVLCAVGGGGCLPQVPAAMRSLWGVLVEDEERRQAAYAMVAIVFEVSVVAAPALVAGIITIASPAAATAAAGAVAAGAALAFGATGASRRWRGETHATGWLGPLAAPGVRTVFAALAALGAAIGIVQVAVPAFTAARGSAETGALLLAALSAGSLAGGLVYGARSWPGRPAIRLALMLSGLAGGCALLAGAGSNLGLAAILLVVGVLLAPATIAGSALLDVVAPAGTVTEAFTVLIMGIVAGSAAGNAAGGAIVDGPGYESAALAAAAIAAGGAALTYARRSTLGTRSASTARSS